MLSILSLPVSVDGNVVAELNLYSRSAQGFDQLSGTVGSVLAAQAGVAVAKSQALASSQQAVGVMQQDVDDRAEVSRAQGILMVLHDCSAEQAGAVLRSAANSDHQTVTAVAWRVAAEAGAPPHRRAGGGPGHWSASIVDHGSASELLGVYAFDACDEEETAAIAAHIAECSDCAIEAARLKKVAGWMGVSAATTPPQELRTRLLREADPGRPDRP